MIPHRKRVQALLDKRGRKEHRQFLVEGVRLVEELLASNLAVERLYHVAALPSTRLARLLDRAARQGVRLAEVAPDELLCLSDTRTPQGVVAVAEVPRWSETEVWSGDTAPGDVVVLDGVRDPGNVGTLVRTAAAAAARGVVSMHGTAEMTNPKVVRSSMGALFHLPIHQAAQPEEVAARCRTAGIPLVLTSAHAGDPPSRLLSHTSVALVLGGEAEGADARWKPLADHVIGLPMSPGTESLNVAVAGGILLFRRIWKP